MRQGIRLKGGLTRKGCERKKKGGEGLRGLCYIERGTSDNGGGCLTLVKQLIDARQTIV